WSPMSMCGANVVLCLPRRSAAACEARRPSTTSVASMTSQSCFCSAAFGEYVRVTVRCFRVKWSGSWIPPRAGSALADAPPSGGSHFGACAPRIYSSTVAGGLGVRIALRAGLLGARGQLVVGRIRDALQREPVRGHHREAARALPGVAQPHEL